MKEDTGLAMQALPKGNVIKRSHMRQQDIKLKSFEHTYRFSGKYKYNCKVSQHNFGSELVCSVQCAVCVGNGFFVVSTPVCRSGGVAGNNV